MGKPTIAKDYKDVETVDLVHTRNSDEYAKVAPRAYRSLHELHKKVNKNSQTPSIARTKPPLPYKTGNQSTMKVLNQADPGTHEHDPSSDYESDWVDDLPSPSALLQANDDTDINHKIGDTAHSDLMSQASASDYGYFGFSGTEDTKRQSNANEGAVESLDSTVFADNQYDEAMGNLESDRDVSKYFMDTSPSHIVKNTGEQKLFMSTDSPEKLISPPSKRTIAQSLGDELDEADSVHEAKRSQQNTATNSESLQPLHTEVDDASVSAVPPVPTIKPGYPDWVYEFDPAFVAEWEPYVEFV